MMHVKQLDLEAIFDLALSSRELEFLIRDDRFAKVILEVSIVNLH